MSKTKEQISYNMSQVKSRDSGIEIRLRKELWRRGLHYRKNVKSVFGKPDIAFIGKKIAVFCDSEFWHGFDWANRKNDFRSHREFWLSKIERNIERDKEVNERLKAEGWTVLRFWGKEIQKDPAHCADIVERTVRKHGTSTLH